MTRNVARILIFLRKMRRRAAQYDVLRVWLFAILIGVAASPRRSARIPARPSINLTVGC